jgi:glycosyltransferase involved in cell wall biosynthesis
MKPIVSAIITTRNEAKNISVCLDSIKGQTYKNIEIIVVDNKSSDATKDIAKQYTDLVFDKGPERSAQRNLGARKAKGGYVVFLDADMVLTPDVINDCVSKIENSTSNIKAIVIPEESFGAGYWAACKALERSFYFNVDWIEAARFFRLDTFRELGGYDEALTGPEDFDLPQRIKEKYGTQCIGRVNSFIRHNERDLSIWQTLSKKYK